MTIPSSCLMRFNYFKYFVVKLKHVPRLYQMANINNKVIGLPSRDVLK